MTAVTPPSPGTRGLKPISKEEMRKPYEEVAEGMETQFASHMIDQMRRTIPRENEPSSAQAYYESLMDSEYAKSLAQSDSGLGIKRVVLEQILPAHLKKNPLPSQLAQSAYMRNVKGVDE